MDGPSAQGFLGLTALQAEGCGGGFAAVFNAACGGKSRKPYNRAWARWKCTPSACGISPGGGDLLCAYFSADLNSSTHSGE